MKAILQFYGTGRQFNDHMSPVLELLDAETHAKNTKIRAYDIYKLRDKIKKLGLKIDIIRTGRKADNRQTKKFCELIGAQPEYTPAGTRFNETHEMWGFN